MDAGMRLEDFRAMLKKLRPLEKERGLMSTAWGTLSRWFSETSLGSEDQPAPSEVQHTPPEHSAPLSPENRHIPLEENPVVLSVDLQGQFEPPASGVEEQSELPNVLP